MNLFLDENEFFNEKRADICVVATQDQDHVRNCIDALRVGYDVLLEKPITYSKEECFRLLEAQKKYLQKSYDYQIKIAKLNKDKDKESEEENNGQSN